MNGTEEEHFLVILDGQESSFEQLKEDLKGIESRLINFVRIEFQNANREHPPLISVYVSDWSSTYNKVGVKVDSSLSISMKAKEMLEKKGYRTEK